MFKIWNLIKKSTDLGLTCGYYELNLKLNDGTNSTFKYCGPFDKEIYYTKKLNWMDKRDFDEAIYMETRKVDKDIEEYDCNDGEVSLVADSKILTNEDKTLIKSDEHCLKYGI